MTIRTVSLPLSALAVLDLTAPAFCSRTPGRLAAMAAGLMKKPRVHDRRHACASWMIRADVPLLVIQQLH